MEYDAFGNEIDLRGHQVITEVGRKQKRPRRSYKSDYKSLQLKYDFLKIIAITGWAAFFTMIAVVVVVQLSEI